MSLHDAVNAIVKLLPTPTASDAKNCTHKTQRGGPALPDEARMLTAPETLLPTPRATDGTKDGPAQRGSKGDLMLPSAVMRLPGPNAADGTS
ncbi:hypothetical protein KIPE111705_06800 [Kibdelosporangium persicum]|uniref:hypothetical protein n=1 Tax=Kibdelosporangium persicum TaxID=2698649 RepID=UPI001FE9B7FB|nr:hypothetical protein [Kibdelosporangium persicum]